MARSSFSSSSLLTDIMRQPMDPGYAVAARRREHRPDDPPGPRPPRRRAPAASAVVVVLGAVLGLVTGAAVAQLRVGPLQAGDRAVLEAEVERRTGIADRLAADNADLRQQIEAEQAAVIGEGAESLLAATEQLAVVSGAVEVTGDGVVVVLDDAPVDEVGAGDAISDDGRVRDFDVQTVVNGLWVAGAEAVSVNDQRLTSLSTIRHAGDAIVVDLRQLARPYTITAVGDPDLLLAELRTGGAGRFLASLRDSYGVQVRVQEADDLRLPAASRLSLRHATRQEAEPVPPAEPDAVVQR